MWLRSLSKHFLNSCGAIRLGGGREFFAFRKTMTEARLTSITHMGMTSVVTFAPSLSPDTGQRHEQRTHPPTREIF